MEVHHELLLRSSCAISFRAGVKDLEVMTQNLMTSAFETVKDVEHGVEIQDIFQHLSSREVHFLDQQWVTSGDGGQLVGEGKTGLPRIAVYRR